VPLLALSLLAPLLYDSLITSRSQLEIGHDDGSFEYTWSDFSPLRAAVRLSLQATLSDYAFYRPADLIQYDIPHET
jgi:hypothetical protein